jgi:hypothetical protein
LRRCGGPKVKLSCTSAAVTGIDELRERLMNAEEQEFVEHWSTLSMGSAVDFYRNGHQGTFLNQKGGGRP